jgi:hypothetical protein
MVAAAKPLRRNSTCSSKKKTTTLWRRKSVLKSTLESLKYVKGLKCECAVQIASNQYHGHLKKNQKKTASRLTYSTVFAVKTRRAAFVKTPRKPRNCRMPYQAPISPASLASGL